jgi:hypothetical protein
LVSNLGRDERWCGSSVSGLASEASSKTEAVLQPGSLERASCESAVDSGDAMSKSERTTLRRPFYQELQSSGYR